MYISTKLLGRWTPLVTQFLKVCGLKLDIWTFGGAVSAKFLMSTLVDWHEPNLIINRDRYLINVAVHVKPSPESDHSHLRISTFP